LQLRSEIRDAGLEPNNLGALPLDDRRHVGQGLRLAGAVCGLFLGVGECHFRASVT
jgi:hypothetical protein